MAVVIMKGTRKNKYNAKKVVVDNITFDSKREAAYYAELQLRARAGEVVGLELQRKFRLIINGEDCGSYTCDFSFFDVVEDRFRVVDVKGVLTREFQRVRKIIKALYQIDIEVVK